MKHKYGDTRPDGYRFRGYNNGYESWLSPTAWESKQARMRKWAKSRRKSDPDYAARQVAATRAGQVKCQIERPNVHMWRRCKVRASIKGMAFTISPEDIVIPERCPVFGLVLRIAKGYADDNSPELDRIDNLRGYVPGNVIVVSRRANRIKNNATITELMTVARFYADLCSQ